MNCEHTNSMNNIDHQLMQQATYKLKMAKYNWNVVKLDNSCNMWGWKMTRFFLVQLVMPTKLLSYLKLI
jgi:hypothetical protein